MLKSEPGHAAPHFQVEWIEETAAGERVRESRTASAAVLGEPWVLEQPAFAPNARRVTATISGADPATGRRARWTLTLGPPGRFAISPVR